MDVKRPDLKSQSYNQDFLRWTEEQSALFHAGKIADLDLDHIIDEIADMGNAQKFALQSAFRVIIIHLLKLSLSPATEPRPGWMEEITEQRVQVQSRIEDTPSLKHYQDELFGKAWKQAKTQSERLFAAYGEKVSVPADCPFSLDQVLDADFFPQKLN